MEDERGALGGHAEPRVPGGAQARPVLPARAASSSSARLVRVPSALPIPSAHMVPMSPHHCHSSHLLPRSLGQSSVILVLSPCSSQGDTQQQLQDGGPRPSTQWLPNAHIPQSAGPGPPLNPDCREGTRGLAQTFPGHCKAPFSDSSTHCSSSPAPSSGAALMQRLSRRLPRPTICVAPRPLSRWLIRHLKSRGGLLTGCWASLHGTVGSRQEGRPGLPCHCCIPTKVPVRLQEGRTQPRRT